MATKMHVTTAVSAGQPYDRPLAWHLIVICCLVSVACGGGTSVTEIGGPEGVRCQVTLAADSTTVPVDGGAVNVSIDAARDCTWTASSDATWATLNATTGQGAGTVGVTVASSQQSTVRTAAIIVNNQRVSLSQEARPCRFTLSASNAEVGAAGGSTSVAVTTPDGCTWRASSTVGWIGAPDAPRTGSGTVSLEIAANVGAQRAGVVTIAGQSFTVTQFGTGTPGPTAPGCMPVVDPSELDVPASAATHSIRLEVAPGCPWMAASNAAPWLTIASDTAGQGAATIRVAAAQNTGAARTGTLTVAAQIVTIRQAAAAAPPPCTFTLDSGSRSFPNDGGEGRVQVTARTGCHWSSASPVDWVTILAGAGDGNGEARYRVQPNPGAQPRSVTITVAGRAHTVNQAGACTFSLNPGGASVDAAGGERRFTVSTQAGCGWSASGAPEWVTIAAGSGTGPGEVIYTVLPNTGPDPRNGTIGVGGQSHTIAQAAPMCTYSVNPPAQTIAAAAGEARFNVATQTGCPWTAQGGTAWLTLAGDQGSGPGQVVFSVQANPAPDPRVAVITVAGQSHTVTQSGAQVCTFSVSPASLAIPAAGGEGRFTVTTQAGCTWAPTGGAAWIAIAPGAGNGTGEVIYTVERNPTSAERVATIVVNGQTHTVRQAAATLVCTYSLNPTSLAAMAPGGEGRFTVVTGAGCSWSPVTMTPWIRITAGGGSGQGDVVYTIDPNSGTEARDGTITVADQTHRVTQGGAAAPPPPSP
jgi:hypothetical protein